MPSLEEQIADLAELRNRAASVCNETNRLIRQFCEVQAAVRARKAADATLRSEVGLVLQQLRRTAG